MKWQLVPSNPAKLVDLPKQPKKERRVFSAEEARQFLKEARNDRLHALWVVLLTTGLRPGEALGLRWDDWSGDRLRIQRSLTRTAEGGWVLAEPKTARSRRSVTLPRSTVDALTTHRAGQAREKLLQGPDYQDDGLIFCTARGTSLDLPGVTRRHFHPILKAAGLPRIRVYDLRHTCATLLLAAGEHPKIVSERLGHSSVSLTLDTYSHVLPDMQRNTAEKLEALLF